MSVRRFARGNGFSNAATLNPRSLLQGEDNVLLYIHGYNNSTLQAANSYDSFRIRITPLKQVEQVGVYWPGESMPRRLTESADPGRLAIWFSLPTYTVQVTNAQTTARLLAACIRAEIEHRHAAFIYGRSPLRRLQISIVAHSLGCRVALELLSQFIGTFKSNLRFPLVALMAAAVPKGLVDRKGSLRQGLEHPDDVIVYSSPNDEALGFAFRLFQLPHLPLDQLFRSGSQQALGLSGSERTQNIHRRHGTRRHGDYWSSAAIAEEVQSAIATGRVRRDPERKLSTPERYVRF